MKCDVCGREGKRRKGHLVPADWWHGEVKVEDLGDVIVVAACSTVCRENFWSKGGRLW